MIFTRYPEYIPAPGSCLSIGLDGCDPDLICQVVILSGGRTLGIKRFRGSESYTVNAGCYLDDTLEVEPYYSAAFCGYRDLPSRMGTVSFRAVQYDPATGPPDYGPGWIESDVVEYTAGTAVCEPWKFLMEMDKELEMCPGESIELPVMIPSGRLRSTLKISGPGWNTIMTLNFSSDDRNRMFSYFIDTAYIEEAIEYKFDDTIELEVTLGSYDTDDELTRRIAIRESPADGTRLCWVNRYGATDYFTFSPVQSTLSTVDKTRIEGPDGTRVCEAGRQEVFTVRSPYTTPENLARLAHLVSARQVWHVRGGERLPVDILTGKVSAEWGRPGCLELSFRYC